jgi:hypothetical protein
VPARPDRQPRPPLGRQHRAEHLDRAGIQPDPPVPARLGLRGPHDDVVPDDDVLLPDREHPLVQVDVLPAQAARSPRRIPVIVASAYSGPSRSPAAAARNCPSWASDQGTSTRRARALVMPSTWSYGFRGSSPRRTAGVERGPEGGVDAAAPARPSWRINRSTVHLATPIPSRCSWRQTLSAELPLLARRLSIMVR